LPGAKFTLRPPSLALSYIGSVTARHSSSGREPNCGVEHMAPPIFSRRPSSWALAHILVLLIKPKKLVMQLTAAVKRCFRTYHQFCTCCYPYQLDRV